MSQVLQVAPSEVAWILALLPSQLPGCSSAIRQSGNVQVTHTSVGSLQNSVLTAHNFRLEGNATVHEYLSISFCIYIYINSVVGSWSCQSWRGSHKKKIQQVMPPRGWAEVSKNRQNCGRSKTFGNLEWRPAHRTPTDIVSTLSLYLHPKHLDQSICRFIWLARSNYLSDLSIHPFVPMCLSACLYAIVFICVSPSVCIYMYSVVFMHPSIQFVPSIDSITERFIPKPISLL